MRWACRQGTKSPWPPNSLRSSDIGISGTANGGFYISWVNRISDSTSNVEGYLDNADGGFVAYMPVIFDFKLDKNPEVARYAGG